jgi:hypothetical protein
VLALGAGQLDDLQLHQLDHDLQAERGRAGQQPLGHVRGEGGQVLIRPAGQPFRQAHRRGRRQAQRARVSGRLVDRGGSVGVLHAGSSSLDLAVLGASHVRRSGEDPTSNPTGLGTTSAGLGR